MRTKDPNTETEITFLEGMRIRMPDDELVLKALADAYTTAGRYDDGYAIDLELVRMCPDEDLTWYNLACSHALLGHIDQAFEALDQAVERGYEDADHLRADEDLTALRPDPRFQHIIEKMLS